MTYKDLKDLLIKVSSKYVSREEAEYFASEIIETEIRKPPPDKKYNEALIKDIVSWGGKTEPLEKKIDLPGYTRYDFDGRGPSLKIKEIHDELERKANANGIAMVSITNSAGMHVMHLWTQGLAKRNLFALGSWNGGPDAVVPINGVKGIMGTNPLTYAFPSDVGEVVVDMATSELPYFKIVGAKKAGAPLPPNTAVDSDGEVTTDPAKALNDNGVSNLLPMGGNYKGYNINYLMEIMTSALIGARISAEMSDAYIEAEHGGFLIAIAIDKVTDRKKYDVSVRAMNEEIRLEKPKAGTKAVIVPGDTNRIRMDGINDDTDIPFSKDFIAKIRALAG